MKTRSIDRTPLVPMVLIDPPALPARESMDEGQLVELAESIAALGVIQPIVIRKVGDRYEIIAGHRRFLAAQRAGLVDIPALIRVADDHLTVALRVHENGPREDWNPAHEANYYAMLLETHCNNDVDQLCTLVRHSRQYVETRLLLVVGDPDVMEAVSTNQISLSIATELNKVQAPAARRMYLDAAKKGGASARMVKQWRAEAEYFDALQAGAPAVEPVQNKPPEQVYGTSLVCILCEANTDHHEMDLVYLHRSCRRLLLDRFLATLRAPAPPAPPAEER